MTMQKQVNRHVDINDNVSFSITNYSEDGYVGILKDTVPKVHSKQGKQVTIPLSTPICRFNVP